MNRKADIYFLLFLTAIISVFVVESQIRVYKQRTSSLITSMVVQLSNIDVRLPSVWASGDTANAQFEISGEYEPESVQGSVSFLAKSDSSVVTRGTIYQLPRREGTFMAKIPGVKMIFKENVEYNVMVSLNFRIALSDSTRSRWLKEFKDPKIVKELERRLASNEIGNKTIERPLTTFIRTKVERKLPGSKFVMVPSTPYISILQGVPWETSVFIGGVETPNDFDVWIVEGKEQYNIALSKSVPTLVLAGKGAVSSRVTIEARHRISGAKAKTSFTVVSRQPVFVSLSNATEAYVGDTYTFDGRLEGIDASKMRIEMSGVSQQSVNAAIVENIPLNQSGMLIFSLYAFDVKVKEFTVVVKEPHPPEITFEKRDGDVVYLLVKSFGKFEGKPNSAKMSALSGVQSITQTGERLEGGTTITTFQVVLRPPSEGSNVMRFEVRAKDRRQRQSKVFIREIQK